MISVANRVIEVIVIPPSTKFIRAVKGRLKFKWPEAIPVPIYHPQVLFEKLL
jgi:hypothetical protein